MGRPSNREARRKEILEAFSRVLADRGFARATVVAVAHEAGVSPGLIHHHFESKDELVEALLEVMVSDFRKRVRARDVQGEDPLFGWGEAALALDETADVELARCWVGLLAEALRDPGLHRRLRRFLELELEVVRRRSAERLDTPDAAAVVSFAVGALVVGAFAPDAAAGFAAPLSTACRGFGPFVVKRRRVLRVRGPC